MILNLLIIPSLFHQNDRVREAGITVTLKLYEIAGEVIRTKVNDVSNLKPSLLREINEEFAKISNSDNAKSSKKKK